MKLACRNGFEDAHLLVPCQTARECRDGEIDGLGVRMRAIKSHVTQSHCSPAYGPVVNAECCSEALVGGVRSNGPGATSTLEDA